MIFLLSEGHFLGFFTQAESENLTRNSGDFRKVAVLENDGAVGLALNGSWWFYT